MLEISHISTPELSISSLRSHEISSCSYVSNSNPQMVVLRECRQNCLNVCKIQLDGLVSKFVISYSFLFPQMAIYVR